MFRYLTLVHVPLALGLLAAGCGRIGFDAAPGDGRVETFDQALPDVFLEPGLIAWFQFEDDPVDGVLDSVIGANRGTCMSTCPAVVPGIRGSAYDFDGTTNVLVIPDSPELHLTTGTLAFWVRYDTLPSAIDQYSVLVGKPFGSNVNNSWELYLRLPAGNLQLAGGSDSVMNRYAVTDWTYGTGTWVHIALTWGTNLRLYTQGQLRAEASGFSTQYDESPILIGADQDMGDYNSFVDGAMDDVRLYERELDASEIAALATAG